MTDRERALAVRAHRQTVYECLTWARLAREAGDEETARAFDRMAAHARRKAVMVAG